MIYLYNIKTHDEIQGRPLEDAKSNKTIKESKQNDTMKVEEDFESFQEKMSKLKKNILILHIGQVIVIDIICNDGFIYEKVGIIESGLIILRKQFSRTKDPFEICKIPRVEGEFRVAYNIWKPFVFKRQVTNYDEISEENASVLDGIDIQVCIVCV